MITVGESKAVIVKGDYTPAEMWSGKSRNLIHVPELNFHRPVLNANYPALSRALNQLDRSRPYRLWYKLDTDGSGGNLGKRAYVHAYYADPALKPEKLTENGQEFYIKGELNSILIYGSNEEDATYNRFYDFCLTADGSDPREYTSPNEGTKVSGWHEQTTSIPCSVDGTYNDTVEITAKGVGFQQTYEVTESQTGKLVQMNLPGGQPLDITVNISAKETPPTTNPVTRSIPAAFENTVEKNVKLKAYGRAEQQIFDETESLAGSFMQMELPKGQPLDVVVNIEATQDGEGDPSTDNVRAIRGCDSLKLNICEKNLLQYSDAFTCAAQSTNLYALPIELKNAFFNLPKNIPLWCSYDIASPVEYTKRAFRFPGTGDISNQSSTGTKLRDNFSPHGYIFGPSQADYGMDYSITFKNICIYNVRFSEFTSYEGNTVIVNLPETSYGGYIDWTKKKYVQTHGKIIVDGTQSYSYNNVRGSVWLKPQNYKERQTGLICDKYRNIGVHDAGKFVLGTCSSDGWLNFFVRNESWESTAELKSVLAADPITVVYELAEPVEYDLSEQITEEISASPDGITTIYSNYASVTVNGAAVPSPLHASEMIPSSGVVESTGKNIFALLPNTNTSGSNSSSTIYLSMTTKELAGMAKVNPGERYVFTREFAGGQLRYFFYEEYPLDSGILSMSGRYCNSSSCKEEILVPENAHYLAVRVTDDKVNRPAGKCMLTKAEASDEYVPYYPATQVAIPQLRAIPDGTGGWSVRDELVSVPAMPGWYDLTRNVAEYIVKGTESNVGDLDLYAHADTTNVGLVQNKIHQTINDVCLCNIALYSDKNRSPWSTNIPGVTVNGVQLHLNIPNSITGVTDDMTANARRVTVNAYLKKRYEDGNPVILWGKAQTPTTERIYLGELLSYPQYTAIDTDGQLTPDVEATVFVSSSDGGHKALENPSKLTGYDTVSITICGEDSLASNKQTYTVNLPHTCYGGYVDWTRKKYVQTHKAFVLDDTIMLGSLSNLAEGFLEVKLTTGGMPNTWTALQSTALCNMLHVNSAYNVGIGGQDGIGSRDNSTIYLRDSIFVGRTADDAKAIIVRLYDAGMPIVFVSNLAEPIEYDLSEHIDGEIFASKDGVTTVFSDMDNVTVNGAKSPSPFHPSEMIPSGGVLQSCGKNLWNPSADFGNAADYPSGNGYYGYRMDLKPNTYYTISAKGNKRLNYIIATTTNQHGQHPTTSAWLSHCTNETLSMPNGYVVIRTRNDGHLFINVNGGNTLERYRIRLSENFDCLQIEEGISPSEYVPYFEPTQISLPFLRGISGTTARDELIPVEGQPGWYDVIHNIGVLETKDCVWHQFSSTNFTSWYCCPFQNRVRPKVKLDLKPGETPRATAVLACNIATCYWDAAVDRPTQMRTQNAQSDANRLYWFNDFKELGDDALPYLQSLWDNSGGAVWYEQVEPTVERIYLGKLRTLSRYTILSSEDPILPDIKATVKVSD